MTRSLIRSTLIFRILQIKIGQHIKLHFLIEEKNKYLFPFLIINIQEITHFTNQFSNNFLIFLLYGT
jgi:hypothetical protein